MSRHTNPGMLSISGRETRTPLILMPNLPENLMAFSNPDRVNNSLDSLPVSTNFATNFENLLLFIPDDSDKGSLSFASKNSERISLSENMSYV